MIYTGLQMIDGQPYVVDVDDPEEPTHLEAALMGLRRNYCTLRDFAVVLDEARELGLGDVEERIADAEVTRLELLDEMRAER